MGDRTKIDWCDASWNPVTGCLHGCPYCYARRIAIRFCSNEHGKDPDGALIPCDGECKFCSELDGFEFVGQKTRWNHSKEPYPYGFMPTFHPHRLDEPKRWKKPRNIFVCSMADLMGEWVPEEWKQDVIKACEEAPQHRYLFLTKNPYGYNVWPSKDRKLEYEFMRQDNFWLGCSLTGAEDLSRYDGHYGRYLYAMCGNMIPGRVHRFVSIEPILTDVMELPGYSGDGSALGEAIADNKYAGHIEWFIVGAETGNRKGKVVPERAWIMKILEACRKAGKPLFMKESLRELMGADFVQEFPWEVQP